MHEDRGNRPSLHFLPLGACRPRGWLLRQLEIQAEGLSGCIENIWDDLGPRSAWLGGDGESWERGPYYMDGLVRLAHVLKDDTLLARAGVWMDALLESQRDDGSFGPVAPETRWRPGWWYLTPALKAAEAHHEATGDVRVVPFLERFFRYQAENLERLPLREWGHARAGEIALAAAWLQERQPAPWLDAHIRRLFASGLDWTAFFRDIPRDPPPEPFEFRFETHIVNVCMALKTPPLKALWGGSPEDAACVPAALERLLRYHGQASGVIAGDEHLAGNEPTRGTELCAVVEMMDSLAWLEALTGDPTHGDHLEQVAYNALPATFDRLMRTHQYDQQVNQVLCSDAERPFVNNGPRANIFGVEPNFGCCAANYHQGWPKLVSRLWMRTADGGLAATVLGPSLVTARVGSGESVTVLEETDYPFSDRIRFTIQTREPVIFPLSLRIPSWAEQPTVVDRHMTP